MTSSVPTLIFVAIVATGLSMVYPAYASATYGAAGWIMVVTLLFAVVISAATKVADQWNRVVVLRLGRFQSLKGPGVFFIIPIIDTTPYWIDVRVITTSFKAEKTLTKDTVPVDVDAVLFWKVVDPHKAALDVADYEGAIGWLPRPPYATSSVRHCWRRCSKGGVRSARNFRSSSMSVRNHGGSR